MPQIDPKRTIGLILAIGLLTGGYVYFSEESPSGSSNGKQPVPVAPSGSSPLKASGKGPGEEKAAPINLAPAPAKTEASRPAVEAKIDLGSGLAELSGGKASLPDPFRGASAELIRLRKEAELLDASIKILDLKAKQAEAELKQKRAKTLAAMIEKDPKILLSLPQETKDGGFSLPSPVRIDSNPRPPSGDDVDIQQIMRSRTPTVRMVILGRDKRVTIDYQGNTFTLAVGDKFQDLEVVNVTPRGALFKIHGKQEFIPVAEKTGAKDEERPSAKPATNTGRPS